MLEIWSLLKCKRKDGKQVSNLSVSLGQKGEKVKGKDKNDLKFKLIQAEGPLKWGRRIWN